MLPKAPQAPPWGSQRHAHNNTRDPQGHPGRGQQRLGSRLLGESPAPARQWRRGLSLWVTVAAGFRPAPLAHPLPAT